MPELDHIRAGQVLVVAGEARRTSRATIRPLGGKAMRGVEVYFRGRRVLYVITLRPKFFRQSTPEARVETLLHELFHISTRFDGTLHRGRRHSVLKGDQFARRLQPIVRRYLARMPPELLEALAFDGEVLARQWLEKPTPPASGKRGAARSRYDEKQLFLGPVEMITASAVR
jgi:predicted metallopeptidase